MNFGDAWKDFMGECNKETSFAMLDYFYEQGGNFIDTANNYQNEESEKWIGEWLASKGNRDEIVSATKFTTGFAQGANLKSNHQGNHSKSLKISVEKSLEKLQTDYIDLLWLHWWDYTTSIPELMNSLNHLVVSGKVLYLGISDTPAWIVVKCNDYARFHGLTQFCVYQGLWNAAERDFERDILPMCEAEGMGLAPWGASGRGRFKSAEDYNAADRDGRKAGPQSDKYIRITEKLDALAKKKETQITSVALAYVMHKQPYVFPIVGGRKIEHLKGNIEALGVELTDEEIEEIEGAEPFDHGFPISFIFGYGGQQYNSRMDSKNIKLIQTAGQLETVEKQHAIPVRQGERILAKDLASKSK